MAATGSDDVLVRDGFGLGEWDVQPSLNQIARAGCTVRLRPRAMDVLVQLAMRPLEVVGREELLDSVWAKRFVADSVLAGAVFELRAALGDDTQEPRYIETIPKRGYRLLATVTPLPSDGSATTTVRRRVAVTPRLAALLAIATAAAVLAVLLVHQATVPDAAVSPPPRLAVLPFENLGPPRDSYFAAGITEEITVRLARLEGLSVIGPASARQYGDSDASPGEIGRDLGAAYLLRGSVRWNGEASSSARVRVTPQLVRTSDGMSLWADTIDSSLEDIFAVQSEISRRVAESIDLAVVAAAQRGEAEAPTRNVAAYRAYLRGRDRERETETSATLLMAIKDYEEALALDPSFMLAWAALARSHAHLFVYGFDRSAARRRASEAAFERARALAPDAPEVHVAAACKGFCIDRDFGRAIAELDRAARSLPGDSHVVWLRGFCLAGLGRFSEALEVFERAAGLDPRNAEIPCDIAMAHMALGQWDQAERALGRSIRLAPDQQRAYLLATLGALRRRGSVTEARAMMDRIAAPSPGLMTIVGGWFALLEHDYQAAARIYATLPDGVIFGQTEATVRELLLARVYSAAGDAERARADFSAAHSVLAGALETEPGDFRLHAADAMALAGLGRAGEAVAEARRACALVPLESDRLFGGAPVVTLAAVQTMTGDYEGAVSTLERLAATPNCELASAALGVDPVWDPLSGRADFERLLARRRGGPRTASP